MGAKENVELATETAEALLTAIKEASYGTHNIKGLENLATAYALVRDAMPKPVGTPSRVR